VLLGDQATAEDIARVQKVYGLDRPLPVQFGLWLQ
jgi:peptide/nickel transport system permease protein